MLRARLSLALLCGVLLLPLLGCPPGHERESSPVKDPTIERKCR